MRPIVEDSNDKKLKFILAMTKHGLSHFDGGGLVGGLGSALGVSNSFTPQGAPTQAQLGASLDQSNAAIQTAQNLGNMSLPGATMGFSNQNALANQLSAMSQGQGPNPAQNQLAQATGANVANQAALMAGQRGSAANVGLLARQNAMQGASTQQGAAGQAATLGAQQQIAAQNNLANLSSQQVGQAGQAAGLFNSAAGSQLNTLENANAAYNTTGATIGAQNAATNSGLLGSITGAIGGAFGLAEGGDVKKMADGGISSEPVQGSAGGSWVGNYLNAGPMASYTTSNPGAAAEAFSDGMKSGKGLTGKKPPSLGTSSDSTDASITGANNPLVTSGAADVSPVMAGGGADAGGISSLLSSAGPLALAASKGGAIRNMSSKGNVVKASSKSEAATKSGNSYDNDKIPAMLSEGEVVIDRNTLNDPGPIGQMARAIRAHIEQRNKAK